jgi:PAS domain S-box-containing protein
VRHRPELDGVPAGVRVPLTGQAHHTSRFPGPSPEPTEHVTARSGFGYAVAVVTVALALVTRWAMDPLIGDRQPFAFFYLAVIITSSLAGLGPSILALGLGLLAGDYFFITPRMGPFPAETGDVVALVAYLVVASAIVTLTHSVRHAERRTERRERSSRQREAEHEAVMVNMGEGLYTVDTQGLVTFINPAGERLFGWTSVELLGRRMHDLTHYKRPDGTPFPADECAGLRVLRDGVGLTGHEDTFIRKDGSFFPVVYSSSRVVVDGKVVGLVVVFRDVTRQKQATDEREQLLGIAEHARREAEVAAAAEREARRAAEAASNAKDAFLATISHELRTPLSPILAWTRMLRKGKVHPEKTSRALEVIDRCAQAQAQLVEDLLDVSRIVSGKLRLEVRPVMLAPVIEKAADIVRPAADAKGLRVQLLLDTEARAVLGDAERLQQVVWNLLSNAVKFTPKGGRVQVVLERVNSSVEIAVSDSGQGIAPDFLPHVFERFEQADVGTSRAHGGLGLGLAIVRHIVEGHGGTVHAESPGVGKGAVFTVKLPLMVARTAAEMERRHPTVLARTDGHDLPRLEGLRLLLVDDEPDSNEVVHEILSSCGAEVRVAASAEQAREILGRWKPDMVVSDVGMPGEDGYAFIASLRATDGGASRLPAVALTAYASREDKMRLLSAGFQAHVTKPIDPGELVTVIANLGQVAGKL